MPQGTHFASTHPRVLADFEAFEQDVTAWKADVSEFVTQMGAMDASGRITCGQLIVSALQFDGKPPSRWKKSGHGFQPFRNNPVLSQFAALTRTVAGIGGVDAQRIISLPTGGATLVSPSYFRVDGTVFLSYAGHTVDMRDEEWNSISVGDFTVALSRYMDAVEARGVVA